MGGDERHGLPPDAAARHGTPRWAPLTADEEQEYETNLHRWNAEALATEVKQAEMELPPLFYCHGSAGGITLEEKEDQLTLSRAMAENPHLLRRELALRRGNDEMQREGPLGAPGRGCALLPLHATQSQ